VVANRGPAGSITTALIYTRVSSDEQAREGLSLDAQLQACRQYAAQQGWVLGHEFQDVLSGKRDDRPQYQALLAEVRRFRANGQGVVVVVAWLHRLGRKVLERVRCREKLKVLGVSTHSVRDGGEVSDLVANILASVAEEEVRQLGERVSAVRRHVLEAGWFPGGRAAWGYRLRAATDEERKQGAPKVVLEADPETAPYVEEAFARVTRNTSVRRVAQWIHSLPASARGGREMPYARLQAMLKSPLYIGRLLHGDPNPLVRPHAHWPALVDDAIWQQAQDYINNHRRRPHQASQRYLLAGFLRCPMCNIRMYGQPRRDRPHRYRCSANVRGASTLDPTCNWLAPMHRIDTPVMSQVAPLVCAATARTPELQDALRLSWQELLRPENDLTAAGVQRRAQLERDVERARRRLTNAAVMFADGDIDKEGYELLREKARADLDAATIELDRLGVTAAPDPQPPPLDVVLHQAGGWTAILAGGDISAKRQVLDVLIDHIVPRRVGHGKYDVDIHWTALGTALRRATEGVASADSAA
jgi:DNA invertase Pin-like site-specific DNA recombinase